MAQGNIAQFTSPIDQLHPSETGAEALNRSARTEAALRDETSHIYSQAADRVLSPIVKEVDRHDTMTDISQGAAALATLHNNFTTQWNEMAAKADPNDKSIQGKFLDDTVEPALQQFQSGFTTEKGQQWAMAQADSLRTHYYDKTSADMISRAGNAAVLNTVQQANQLVSVAYKDPQSVDSSIQQVDAYYDAAKEHYSGMLNAEHLNKLDDARADAHNEIIKSAIKGYADSDDPTGPDKARAVLESGAYDKYLPAKEQDQLRKYIDNQVDARDVEKQQVATANEWKQTQVNEQEVKGIFSQISAGKGYQATTAFSNDKLSKQQKNDFVAKKDGILTLPPSFLNSPSYGDNFGQIAQGVYNGQTINAGALTMGVRRQEITPAGAVKLQEIADKMKTPEGMAEVSAQKQVLSQMRSQIVKGGYDPKGEEIYNNSLNSFYASWDAGIKAGKTPAELADPQSKDYIGNMANVYKRSDAQALADVTKVTPPAPKAVIPVPEQRVLGRSYPTPRGNMTWTGTGWVPTTPAAKATPQVPRPE